MTELTKLADSLKTSDFTELPIIDLSEANSSSEEKRRYVAAKIRDAALNQGFFYVKNHSVPDEVVEETFGQSKKFFALSEEVKRSIDVTKSDNFRGYMAILTENCNPENKGELHEAFNLGLDPLLDPYTRQEKKAEGTIVHGDNQWLSSSNWEGADEFKQTALKYYSEVLTLGKTLFHLFALALDLPETFFDDKIQHPAAIMRLLFYPAQMDKVVDEKTPGIGVCNSVASLLTEDYECFTILRQGDVPALQVKNKKGDWIDAPCIPGTFVINIGDQFARWTNDVFVSTVHRARASTDRDRYSIPFFFGCDHDVQMEPIPTCVSADRPNKYEIMKAGEYVHMRLTETYLVNKTTA